MCLFYSFVAPTTPIASAKRPRISEKDRDMKSPMRGTSSQSVIGSGNGAYNSNNNKTSINVPIRSTAPSKALFSPVGQSSQDDEEKEEVEGSEPQSKYKGNKKIDADAEAKRIQREEEKEKEEKEAADAALAAEQEDDDDDVFNPYQFISGLPKVTSIDRNEVMIPPSTEDKPTLALDLDETLVHCTVEPIDNPDLIFPVTFNGTLYDVYVRKRPYLDYFLEAVSMAYEVIVFTASQRVYADVLLDLLDPKKKYIKHRLFRESCVMVQGNFLKDLHVLGRDYSRMALVDNSPHAYGFQIENGIPIESWFDDDTDTELLKLVGFLRKAFAASDVRSVIKDHFKTHVLVEKASLGEEVDLAHAPPYDP